MPVSRAKPGGASSAEQTTNRVVNELKQMIVSGELLPGQQVRQESLASRLGVSRLPVRESLRQLAADGLLTHTHNAGYAVARLSQQQFDQIYLMRRLLETELILQLPKPTQRQLTRITRLNDEIVAAAQRLDLGAMRTLNYDFHFAIFRLASMELMLGEIDRLWTWAMPYHSVYLFDPGARERILKEHQEMIEALKDGDNARLAAIMDEHRHGSEVQLNLMLKAGAAVSIGFR